jgi:pimeloyl-ACP methyl ester carboxylesterase
VEQRGNVLNRRNVEILQSDGVVLRGVALLRTEPKTNIIYFGGSAETAQAETEKITQWSDRYNANVIFVDYRGYGASGGLPALEHLPDDALSVYDNTGALRGGVPTVVVGFSLGSLSATYLAAHRQVQGLILMAPISSFSDRDMYTRARKRQMLPWYHAPFARWVKIRPAFEIPEGLEPIQQIQRVSAPLLLIHGNEDEVIPVRSGRKIYDLATGGKTLLLLPRLGHDDLSLTEAPAAEYVARFIDQIL